jgi:hypothetical protein
MGKPWTKTYKNHDQGTRQKSSGKIEKLDGKGEK